MTTRAPAHAVVVLAAGGSTRLGQPKQWLCRDGETLLHRAVRLATETAPDAVWVVVAEANEATSQALADLRCTQLVNTSPTADMADSLRTAAGAVRAVPQVLVMLCDQPALTRGHLRALLDGARGSASGCAATLLHGLAAVPAVVPGHWFDAVPSGTGRGGFRQRLRALPRETVFLLPSTELELDIDTPDDLRAARQQGLIDAKG